MASRRRNGPGDVRWPRAHWRGSRAACGRRRQAVHARRTRRIHGSGLSTEAARKALESSLGTFGERLRPLSPAMGSVATPSLENAALTAGAGAGRVAGGVLPPWPGEQHSRFCRLPSRLDGTASARSLERAQVTLYHSAPPALLLRGRRRVFLGLGSVDVWMRSLAPTQGRPRVKPTQPLATADARSALRPSRRPPALERPAAQVSSTSVTGPSFVISTTIRAPNTPVSTGTPCSRSAAQNRR